VTAVVSVPAVMNDCASMIKSIGDKDDSSDFLTKAPNTLLLRALSSALTSSIKRATRFC
jgi:hypothetical protein